LVSRGRPAPQARLSDTSALLLGRYDESALLAMFVAAGAIAAVERRGFCEIGLTALFQQSASSRPQRKEGTLGLC